MNRDALSMRDLFPVCNRILTEAMMPLHYVELTKRALAEMGINEHRVNMYRVVEDVREKMLIADSRKWDVFYTGKPECLTGKRRWFKQALFHSDEIVIPGDAYAGFLGAFETAMRGQHMMQKVARASGETIARARGRGLTIEKHVTEWFRRKWPEFYREPDNQGDWQRPCGHDFKLALDGQVYEVDVTGPRSDGTFGRPKGNKPKAHLHLFCLIDRPNVIWRGVEGGNRFAETDTSIPETAMSPERMVVWLNCRQAGINHYAIATAVERGDL